MSEDVLPFFENSDTHCECEELPCDKKVPCGCCPFPDSDSYSEFHGFDECPNVSAPCGGAQSPSCSSLSIGPIKLKSKPFHQDCVEGNKKVKAAVSAGFDNFGYIDGADGKTLTSNYGTDACQLSSLNVIKEAYLEPYGTEEYIAYVFVYGQNSPHGGPYYLSSNATFYLE